MTTPTPETPKWADLFGIDPDYTEGACAVDWVRWGRGATTVDEFEHSACFETMCNRAES